jgi:hypothetical protein
MNAEKELLLALLIEKYTAPKPIVKPAQTAPKRARKFKKPHHKWTRWEKEKLVGLKSMGKPWSEIAAMLGKGLSAKQCHSMYHNILVAERKIKNG